MREFIKYVSADLTAEQMAHLSYLNINTINRLIGLIRQRIDELTTRQSAPLKRQIEVDESYFGAKRVKGLRGRGARGKTIVFGLLKREDTVITEVVPDCSASTRQSMIRGETSIENVIYSDGP